MLSVLLSMADSMDKREKILYLYDRYYSLMAYTVSSALPNTEKKSVDDIVHDAMIDIIGLIESVDVYDTVRAKALCVLIAKRRAIDHMRIKDNQTMALDDVMPAEVSYSYTPEDEYADKVTMDIILKAIDCLDDTYRETCRLKYVVGLKEREIASVLGISQKAVSMRIMRGKQILQRKLRKELYGE